ncbi:MAG TPA: DinB family protein [Acidobacteriaceae bacterium]|nr:DinB family protein [Acidobacteriaceae bacterium]
MNTTAAEALGEVRVYGLQVRAIHAVVKRNVDELTEEESLIQPQPGGNCLNWVVGHLLYVYDQTLPMLGQTPVLGVDTLKRYGRGTAQIENAAEALNFALLMAAWDEATQRMEAGVESLSPEVLDQPAPWSPTNNSEETVRSLLSTILFHQAYHVGQTGLLRRIAGKEGAIR